MVDKLDDSAKADAVDARDVAPADSRERMWRAVKLYAWLATLICAVWGLWTFTVYVYRQPPPCPANALGQAMVDLRCGMTEEETRTVLAKYAYGDWCAYNAARGDYLAQPRITEGTSGERYVLWRWEGVEGERWDTKLELIFKDGRLVRACYHPWWHSHGRLEERRTDFVGGRVVGSTVPGEEAHPEFIPDK